MLVYSYYDTTAIEALGWKITEVTDVLGVCYTFQKQKPFQHFTLRRFPGDCGTLTLHSVSHITREALQIVREIASQTGNDTVICTYLHVSSNTEEQRTTVENFRKERWIKAVSGKSNRKYNYKTNQKIVYILHIRNCKHKGY